MSKKGGFQELLFTTIMPKVYGIGAAVVIVGAMFKILHWPGAPAMLGIGLTTEALIFLFSAFEPKHAEVDWTKVYPELAEDFEGDYEDMDSPKKVKGANGSGDSASKKMDAMLESAKIGPELIESLGKGMKNLADSASKMSNLADAAVATKEYAQNVTTASKSLTEMNKSYSATAIAMSEMANASKDSKEYHSQVQNATKHLSALNQVYELELKDANTHIKAMNKFYSNLTVAMESMSQASKESENFKNEITKLTGNLTNLNKVYGNMLTAMKG